MKALTVRQPWASLIVRGVKDIETRSQRTNVRGRIGVIAGAAQLPVGLTTLGDYEIERERGRGNGMLMRSERLSWPYRLPLGALIGTVELYDCVPISYYTAAPPIAWRQSDTGRLLVDDSALSGRCRDATDQLPYGDFTHNRWAWLLRDPEPCDPQPWKGSHGWQEVAP